MEQDEYSMGKMISAKMDAQQKAEEPTLLLVEADHSDLVKD